MKVYAGIDLHSSNNYVGIINDQDQRVYQKRLPNQGEHILEALETFKESMEGIVVESTYNWYWLVYGLQARGYKLHRTNPSAIKQYEGLKHRTAHILSPQSMIRRNRGTGMSVCGSIKMLDKGTAEILFNHPHLVLAAKSNIAVIYFLKERIRLIEKTVRSHTKLRKEMNYLAVSPGGISPTL